MSTPAQPIVAQYGPDLESPYIRSLFEPRVPAPTATGMSPSAGWGGAPVGAMNMGLQFLEGARKARVNRYVQQEVEAGKAEKGFQAWWLTRRQDPDLTPDARQALDASAMQVMGQHAVQQTKGADKKGVGGFFRNMLVELTGGEMKGREPINLHEQVGSWEGKLNQTPELRQSYWENRAVEKWNDEKKRLEGSGQLSQENAVQVLEPILAELNQHAPEKVQGFLAIHTGGLTPEAQLYPRAVSRVKSQLLQQMMGELGAEPPQPRPAAETGVPAAGAGSSPVVPTGTLPAGAPSPTAGAPAGPPAGPAYDSATTSSLQLLKKVPPMLREDLFGKPEHTNLHSPDGTQVLGAIRYPQISVWLNPANMEPYAPGMQNWPASTAISRGAVHTKIDDEGYVRQFDSGTGEWGYAKGPGGQTKWKAPAGSEVVEMDDGSVQLVPRGTATREHLRPTSRPPSSAAVQQQDMDKWQAGKATADREYRQGLITTDRWVANQKASLNKLGLTTWLSTGGSTVAGGVKTVPEAIAAIDQFATQMNRDAKLSWGAALDTNNEVYDPRTKHPSFQEQFRRELGLSTSTGGGAPPAGRPRVPTDADLP